MKSILECRAVEVLSKEAYQIYLIDLGCVHRELRESQWQAWLLLPKGWDE
jgi:hypothetical protein